MAVQSKSLPELTHRPLRGKGLSQIPQNEFLRLLAVLRQDGRDPLAHAARAHGILRHHQAADSGERLQVLPVQGGDAVELPDGGLDALCRQSLCRGQGLVHQDAVSQDGGVAALPQAGEGVLPGVRPVVPFPAPGIADSHRPGTAEDGV